VYKDHAISSLRYYIDSNLLCRYRVIPVGPDGGIQYLYRVERVGNEGDVVGVDTSRGFHENDFKVYRVLGVRYVPLVRAD
jgi:hypothetical protein